MTRSQAKRRLRLPASTTRVPDTAADDAPTSHQSSEGSAYSSEKNEFEVERIVEEKDGRFLVKWKGYESSGNTWEPENNLAKAMIRAFRQKRKSSAAPSSVPPSRSQKRRETTEAQHGGALEVTATSFVEVDLGDNPENSVRRDLPLEVDPAAFEENERQWTKLIGARLNFSAANELWMQSAVYNKTGGAYLTGIVTRLKYPRGSQQKKKNEPWFEIRWTTTSFQGKENIHFITRATVLRGIVTHDQLNGTTMRPESWEVLCRPYDDSVETLDLLDDYEAVDDEYVRFQTNAPRPVDAIEVEKITGMDFHPQAHIEAPVDLFCQEDGNTSPRIRDEYRMIFEHSASSSFLAYLPLAFWRKVVENTNASIAHTRHRPVSLDELMKFLGVLFYMAIVDKGEYANYWGQQVEDRIFRTDDNGEPIECGNVSLDRIMTLKRFQLIRKHLSFRNSPTPDELKRDPPARIRPLMNMLKVRSGKFVELGRNCAVDETSIACRSKYGRHMIVFNSSKPTGKYHFKIYMCCCSESWLMVNFRLHCASEIQERLDGVVYLNDARALEAAIEESSEIRRHVIEVTRPLHGTKRIVNTDNLYTSTQLLEALRVFGLKIAAASWVDGAIVNIVSNADSSTATLVKRQVKQQKVSFTAPTCVIEYNQAMQGVDRIDQLRGRFSIVDGHTFRKWHKKLALAFIDIARCNAYITYKMANDTQSARDPHRSFMVALVSELLDGSWEHTLTDAGLRNSVNIDSDVAELRAPARDFRRTPTSPANTTSHMCIPRHSAVLFKKRAKRGCVICRFEGRHPTEMTNYCMFHKVSLCSQRNDPDPTKPYTNQDPDLPCWEKFHLHYLPKGLFNESGRIRRSSTVYKATRPETEAELFSSVFSTASTDYGEL